jgi:hypothetical protein
MQAKREKERKEQEAERAGREEEREVEKYGMEKEAATVDIARKRREEVSKFTQEQLLSLDPDDPEFDQKKMQIADEVGNYAHSIGIPAPEIVKGAESFVKGYTPEVAKQFRIKAGMAAEEETTPTPKTAMAAFLQQKPNATPDEIAEFAQKMKGKGIKVTLPDGTVMEVGGTDKLTPATTSKTQKDIIGLEQQLSDLKTLGSDFKKDYLTYGGKIKRFALKQASKFGADIGEGGKEFIQGARRFQEGVEQVFNAYRKEITGAQAAMKEIAMLRESILNKDLAPDEFEASYNRYIEQINRHLKLKKYFLSKGITDSKELGNRIDASVVSGSNAIDLRGDEIEQELIDSGIPEEEIQNNVLQRLKQEGYF